MAFQLLPLLLFGGAAAVVLSGNKKPKKPKKSKIARGQPSTSSNCMKLSDIQKNLKRKNDPLPIHLMPQIDSVWKQFQGPAIAQGLISINSANKMTFSYSTVIFFADSIVRKLGCRSLIDSSGQPYPDVSYVEYRLLAAMIGCAEGYLYKQTSEPKDPSFLYAWRDDPALTDKDDPLPVAVRRGYSAPTNEDDVIAGIIADYKKLRLPENPQSFKDFKQPPSELEKSIEDHVRSISCINGLGGKGVDMVADAINMAETNVSLQKAKLYNFIKYIEVESAAAYCLLRANAMPGYESMAMISNMSRFARHFFIDQAMSINNGRNIHPVIVGKFGSDDVCFVRCSIERMVCVSEYMGAMRDKGYFKDEERGAALLLLITSESPGAGGSRPRRYVNPSIEDYLKWWSLLPKEVKMIFDSLPNSNARSEALYHLEMRHPALHKLYNLMVDTVISYNEGWLEFK